MKTLIDTSVWINHFNKKDLHLIALLESDDAVIHPFILGELMCGQIPNRNQVIHALKKIKQLDAVTPKEFEYFINEQKIYSSGLGFVDCHLLASAMIGHCALYTHDKTLDKFFKKTKV